MSDLQVDHDGAVSHLRINRPAKRNALNDGLVAELHTAFVNLPQSPARSCSAAKASTSAPDSICPN